MTRFLKWPGFQLDYSEGVLDLIWTGTATLNARIDRCAAASLRTGPENESGQLALQFRGTAPDVTDLIAVRIDVPAAHMREVDSFVGWLRSRHGVPDRHADNETSPMTRIPVATGGWLVAPTSPASEQLFDEVMDRIADS